MKSRVAFDSSLERLFGLLETHNPNLLALLRAKTEGEFIEATEGAIDSAIRTIESGAKQYSKLGERGLSLLLTDFLNKSGYQATAERYVNGHVDVVIEHAFGRRWKYLGECKIHKSYRYHIDGCKQVLGYCTGRERRVFCLDFFNGAGMYQKLAKLRERMDVEEPLEQTAPSQGHAIAGAFVTIHTHKSKRGVELLHLGCSVPKP
ncbi:hypothetical protein WME73_37745 [Sorangium sp. So ce302]|uniref:hypothetical protein n=1 Tax=Sorangium sp. So ce302 TaxID=3133297 RepID=UPI003F5DF720